LKGTPVVKVKRIRTKKGEETKAPSPNFRAGGVEEKRKSLSRWTESHCDNENLLKMSGQEKKGDSSTPTYRDQKWRRAKRFGRYGEGLYNNRDKTGRMHGTMRERKEKEKGKIEGKKQTGNSRMRGETNVKKKGAELTG